MKQVLVIVAIGLSVGSACNRPAAPPAPAQARSVAKEAINVDIDLQQDAADAYAFVVSRAAAYKPAGDRGPGGQGPVKMVYAGYEFAQTGWFALIFDRRPNAGHDGEWTRYLEGNILDRPKWVTAQMKNEEKPIQVRGEDGSVTAVPAGSAVGPMLGRMLVGVLQRAEREGAFAHLPRADGFKLGLEEINGTLGWDSETGYGGQPE